MLYGLRNMIVLISLAVAMWWLNLTLAAQAQRSMLSLHRAAVNDRAMHNFRECGSNSEWVESYSSSNVMRNREYHYPSLHTGLKKCGRVEANALPVFFLFLTSLSCDVFAAYGR